MQRHFDRQYDPRAIERTWYERWLQQELFSCPDETDKPRYSILMPPPNVTGVLTMGHVLNNTIQDLYIRYHRKKGKVACWFPGLDHAGIATQSKVEAELLRTEGKTRWDLGREEFLRRVWQWKEQYGGIILEQLRSLGVSCDWKRTLFTMDESASNAVREVFIRLFDAGLIYRGKRIINWSPALQSALSDEEVIYRPVEDTLYTLKYAIEGAGHDEYIAVATVRPETIFGDVAVAVHPDDERYRHLIGCRVRVPLTDRFVPVIADSYVDPTFGTGCLKITPAHDPNDYEIGVRHSLPVLVSINADGRLNDVAGPYAGLDRFEARKRIVEDLRAAGLIVQEEPYVHNVGFSERSGEPIEPFYSDQWFVRMQPLAEPALKAVLDGKIRFFPEHWTKTYEHWMRNIRDWCISRQLWWGHRIPVFYAPDGRYTAARDVHHAREKLGLPPTVELRQDEDSLDTWFSSWLWMLTTMRWLHDGKTEDTPILRTYLPTDLLVTGPDIIFFWVARMIMASLYFRGVIPFRDVYFTSIIRDDKGRKMSKSLGNSPDPLKLIDTYGADAVRYTVLYLAPVGQDVRITVDPVTQDAPQMELGRNFANKLWNAARFLALKADEVGVGAERTPLPDEEQLSLADRWIRSRLHATIRQVDEHLERYRINEYVRVLYDFFWHDYCDWYIELLKVQLQQIPSIEERQRHVRFALQVFEDALGLLHPLMPFITEELWHRLGLREQNQSLCTTLLPTYAAEYEQPEVEQNMERVMSAVEQFRMLKATANLKPSDRVPTAIRADGATAALLGEHAQLIAALARIEQPRILGPDAPKPQGVLSALVVDAELFVIVGDHVLERERQRLLAERQRLEHLLSQTRTRLANEQFLQRAKPEVVESERAKERTFVEALEKINASLQYLSQDV
jgi:valyl-tRNA synthetase